MSEMVQGLRVNVESVYVSCPTELASYRELIASISLKASIGCKATKTSNPNPRMANGAQAITFHPPTFNQPDITIRHLHAHSTMSNFFACQIR